MNISEKQPILKNIQNKVKIINLNIHYKHYKPQQASLFYLENNIITEK